MQLTISNALEFFEEATKNTDKIVFAFDVGAKQFLTLNPAFERVWEKSLEEITTEPIKLLDVIHAEDKEYLLRNYRELENGDEKKEVEFRIQLPDKGIRWLGANIFMSSQEGGKRVVVGLAEDISDRKEKEDDMQKFAAKKNSVLEILSHDLAGPLNNIKGISSLLADEVKSFKNHEVEKMIGMITSASERSINLIRDFVKQEFLESAQSSLVKRRVDIVKKIKEVLNQYQDSATEISKEFHFNTAKKKLMVKIDAYKFDQVINNLISNAIKFTEDDGEITISIEDREDSFLLSVADNGIGIPEKYQDSLFEKFTKARRPGLKGEPSTGLGMSIIKTIVEWHGGRIWFESEENKGSTFYIELPKE